MKKSTSFYLAILLFFCNQNISAQITLSSQAEVDAWDQSIEVLTEHVIITGSDITNIDALSNLRDVESELEIRSNIALTNIDGLSGLEQVTGLVNIIQNDALVSIDGFLGLTDFIGNIQLQFNDGLTNIDGFTNLKNISGTISLWNNDALINIDGFLGLDDISGKVIITNSDLLENIDGFSNLDNFTGLIELTSCDGLTNLDVFAGYTDIQGSLVIENIDNSSIRLDALSNLTNVSGGISISNISSLSDIDIFLNLTDVTGVISINRNEQLLNINGFTNLADISGRVTIRANNLLTDINGFAGLEDVSGELRIISNNSLVNLDALSGLEGFSGNIYIDDNNSLTSIHAFTSFTNISGKLIIDNNDGLTNLNDLSSLSQLTGSLEVIDNISLSNIDGLSGLKDIEGTLVIQNNDALLDIQVFLNLLNLTGNLRVTSNSGLTSVNGFLGLTNITGRIDISTNENLTDISGFSNLSVIEGTLGISGNDALTNVDGLGGLDTITGSLFISLNSSLENIDGLMGLSSTGPGSRLEFRENQNLTNLNGLSGLTNLDGNLFIQENHALENIDGLLVLTEISNTADVRIIENNALTNLNGFSNVKNIYRHLRISNNSGLTQIDGLSQVQELSSTGHLEITHNENLINVDGLSGLRRVNNSARLTIQNNNALTNLDGLYGLEETRGRIIIDGNDQLSACCGLSEAIENGELQDFAIDTNRIGCNSVDEILDACSLTLFYDLIRPCEGIDNGRVTFFASDYDAIPFSYEWEETTLGDSGSGVSNSDQFSIDNLAPGIYNITVTLPNGARESFQNVVLDPIEGSIFEITKLTSTNSTNGIPSGNIYLEYSGGQPPYSLEWIGPNSDSRSDIITNFYTMFGLGAGEYSIQLTDADGQSKIVDITLLDDMVPVFPCSEPLDIVILNDVSGSVDAIEYDESKIFFVDFLKAANIGQSEMESQACVIEWSSSDMQSLIVPLTGNINELESYQDATRAFSAGTAPHPAMQFGYDYVKTNGRSDVEKVLILSTDGFPSPSLIALADEFKAEGYHIITVAFDDAYERGNIRDILTLVASVPLLASGAPAYSDLDADLADDIVNLYLCPLVPGESSSVYFNRDGAIKIDSAVGVCPIADFVELNFTVSAHRELSIPAGTSVMFYHNDPLLFGASPILDYSLPCAIAVGTSESFTVSLPSLDATKLYALLNDDGSRTPPLNFPITDLQELAYSNNIDTISICINDRPTLQALKYTTTPTPICDSILMYTIDVCNIGTTDAFDVLVNDDPPSGSIFSSIMVNDNGCSSDNGGTYDIPVDCCVSISLTYNVSEVPNGYYGSQNVELSGPTDQEYINYDGSQSSSEDVSIEEGIDNCPSTEIWFTKEVNSAEVCEDDFLVYTYTIHNETNSVIHGARFTDELPEPMMWVYKPYFLNGLSINTQELSGTIAEFIIDEIPADTIATFQIDAYTGDWLLDGMVSSAASLENVVDLENGGIQTLQSNTVNTIVYDNAGTICDSLWTNTLEVGQLESVILFPNPTTCTIKFKNLNESVNYRLLSYTGQIYEEGEYVGGELQLGYEGVNLVQLILDGEIKTFKVLKIGEGR